MYPIVHCRVTEDLWTQGMGQALLSRELPDGSIAVAIFLVDRYCLGVKNALARIMGRFTYESDFVRKIAGQFPMGDFAPTGARKLVEDALAYAEDLGFHPHADYHKAKPLFGTIDPAECHDQFEFGKDGKPMFIAGPHDTPERCRKIMATLLHRCGRDGFHYLIPMADPDRVLPEAMRTGQARLIGEHENGEVVEYPIDFDRERTWREGGGLTND